MPINMIAAADAAQFESKRLNKSLEFSKADVAQFSPRQAFPQIASAGT